MKDPHFSPSGSGQPDQSTKKKYETPRLTEFGSVRHTTRGSSGPKNDGMGTQRTGMNMGMGMGMGMGGTRTGGGGGSGFFN